MSFLIKVFFAFAINILSFNNQELKMYNQVAESNIKGFDIPFQSGALNNEVLVNFSNPLIYLISVCLNQFQIHFHFRPFNYDRQIIGSKILNQRYLFFLNRSLII